MFRYKIVQIQERSNNINETEPKMFIDIFQIPHCKPLRNYHLRSIVISKMIIHNISKWDIKIHFSHVQLPMCMGQICYIYFNQIDILKQIEGRNRHKSN